MLARVCFPLSASLRLALFSAAALVAAACSSDTAPNAVPPTPPNTVSINGATATVAIAATRAARSRGLMGVTRMAADSGMLFVFAADGYQAFWMKDTPIPLSIAFLDASKRITFLADMAPNDTLTHTGGLGAGQIRYALEMNQGWFAAHAINVGMVATFTLPTGIVVEPDP